MQVTYELHVLTRDRWTIERTYPGDQKRRALDHARELYAEPHITAVKVISETYDEATNQSRDSTIFTAAPGARTGAAAARQRAPRPAAPQPAPAPRAAAKPAGPPPLSTVKLAAMLLALIAAVVVLGFVAMRGSEMLSGLG